MLRVQEAPGDRNWLLPAWLDWILELRVEGRAPSHDSPVATAYEPALVHAP